MRAGRPWYTSHYLRYVFLGLNRLAGVTPRGTWPQRRCWGEHLGRVDYSARSQPTRHLRHIAKVAVLELECP